MNYFIFWARWQNCEKRILAPPCPSVCPRETTRLPMSGFSWHLIFEYLSKICPENWSSLKSGMNNGHFTWRPIYICDNASLNFFLGWEIFWTKVVRENQNTHFVFNNLFWKVVLLRNNVEIYGRARQTACDSIIRRMRIACWIQTHTHYVILTVFWWQQWFTRTHHSVTIYVHCVRIF